MVSSILARRRYESVEVVTENSDLALSAVKSRFRQVAPGIWEHKIKSTQRARYAAGRFVHRFTLSEPDSRTITKPSP